MDLSLVRIDNECLLWGKYSGFEKEIQFFSGIQQPSVMFCCCGGGGGGGGGGGFLWGLA